MNPRNKQTRTPGAGMAERMRMWRASLFSMKRVIPEGVLGYPVVHKGEQQGNLIGVRGDDWP